MTWLGRHHPYVDLDIWVIMPDHLHGIIVLLNDEDIPVSVPKRKPLGRLVGAFKTVSTKALNQRWETPGVRFWQRNYYEHIVRDERDLARIRAYIAANPRRWLEKQRGART
jgi:REP element-mobilizing transposase RayT